jgi:uncharacterized protein YcbK (DUF882 family)
MGDLSEHFSASEFKDKRTGAERRPPCRLLVALEFLRRDVNRPLLIVSGYRSPETNRAVGGATSSRHLLGDAVDIPAGYATLQQAEAAGFVGIGTRGGWVIHVDVRPGGPARWTYDGA